jgi:hypothetical protein
VNFGEPKKTRWSFEKINSKGKKMKAWLITWDWIEDHAKVGNPLIAIFSARKPTTFISDYIRQYYLMATSSASDIAYYMNRTNRIPYKPNNQGHNPWIYARVISSLKIETDDDKDIEILTWQEPDHIKWENGQKKLIKKGDQGVLKRKALPLISVC